jgi:hypothetical protein
MINSGSIAPGFRAVAARLYRCDVLASHGEWVDARLVVASGMREGKRSATTSCPID